MLEPYTPEPFSAPFPEDFDPRDGVYEVVEKDASGAIRIVSSRGQLSTVAPSLIAEGVNTNPQDRVLGVAEVPKKAGFLGKLLGRESDGQPALRVEALQPNRSELAFAQMWLQSLVKAGLKIENVDLHPVLMDRLRTAPFGSRRMTPLRKILRPLLEELVGRYPQRDDSWGADDAPALARELLAELGVKGFEPPSPKRVKHRWHAGRRRGPALRTVEGQVPCV